MINTNPTYSVSFMDKVAIKTGSDIHRYLTLKLPLVVDSVNANKIWDVSKVVCFTCNKLTEHQNVVDWKNGYYEIKKLLPIIKATDPWLKVASSQVLQEVAKSHAAVAKGCKTKRAKTNKVTGAKTKESKANPPGFKASRFFHSHKYPQQDISFKIDCSLNSTRRAPQRLVHPVTM
jgi:hypothetical protein